MISEVLSGVIPLGIYALSLISLAIDAQLLSSNITLSDLLGDSVPSYIALISSLEGTSISDIFS